MIRIRIPQGPRAVAPVGGSDAAWWCNLVYSVAMPPAGRPVRQSVTLAAPVARRVRSLAHLRKTSASRVLADLVESGLEAREREKQRFFEIAERLALTKDRDEQARLKEELARMTFGD